MYKLLLLGLVIGVLPYTAVMAHRLWRLRRSTAEAKASSTAFNQMLKNAKQHILVIGDSTMHGAGQIKPEETMGGLLATKFPQASVETLAEIDARVRDLPTQLARAKFDRYDIILIGVGGNDVARFSHWSDIERDLTKLLELASEKANEVAVCTNVNLGNIGFFLFPINHIFDHRSRKYGEICAQVMQHFPNVHLVNLYRPIHEDFYNAESRSKFVTEDGFHPSAYANKFFFNMIWPG